MAINGERVGICNRLRSGKKGEDKRGGTDVRYGCTVERLRARGGGRSMKNLR